MQLQNVDQSRNEERLSDLEAFDRLIQFRYAFDRDSLVQRQYEPTKFSLATGENAVVDDILSYQQYNRLKNAFPDPAAPVDVVAGMTWYKSSTQRYYFYDGTAAEQVELWSKSSKIALTNLLSNSALSVWSQSDTNQGIGAMTYDSGSVAPVVGETLTGATSSAVGKVISYTLGGGTFGGGNAYGVIQLGACAGRFQDNEDITGSAGGANILTVNMPSTGVGVDLVQNGDFSADEDPPNGWTASNATLSTEAGGDVGNCMKVLDGGAGNGYGSQQIATVVGKIYRWSVWAKDIDTGQNGLIEIGTAAGGAQYYSSGAITDDAGDTYTGTFEATTTTTFITLNCTSTGGTYYFDSVFCYEITPGCTGADNVSFDTWYKDSTIDIYRQHNDDGTLTKDGSFYSLKMVITSAADYVIFPSLALSAKAEWYRQFAGQTITLGCWLKTSKASHAYIRLYDGVGGTTGSDFHTGGGAWEWIEVTKTCSAAATDMFLYIQGAQAGETGGDTIIYASQPMLVFGSSIGEGNYSAPPGEIIRLDKTDTYFQSFSNSSNGDLAGATYNLEAESKGILPKGIKAIGLYVAIRDSAADPVQSVGFRGPGSSIYWYFYNVQGNDVWGSTVSPLLACDANGDIMISAEASGGDTLDIYIGPVAVQVR